MTFPAALKHVPIPLALEEFARKHGRPTPRGAVAALGANHNTIKSHLRQPAGARQLTQHEATG